MRVTDLSLPGIKLIEPTYLDDSRGYAVETYNSRTLQDYGIFTKFVMDYECSNLISGTVRGIHFQANPHAQIKLIRVLQGEILDFAVDLRKDSPTYKKWICITLSEKNRRQLYLPSGYGHAYVTKQPNTVVLYKFSDFYDSSLARSIRWDDPEIGINWDCCVKSLSEKDRNAPFLADSDVNLTIREN